jgi:hypothetical protein
MALASWPLAKSVCLYSLFKIFQSSASKIYFEQGLIVYWRWCESTATCHLPPALPITEYGRMCKCHRLVIRDMAIFGQNYIANSTISSQNRVCQSTFFTTFQSIPDLMLVHAAINAKPPKHVTNSYNHKNSSRP